MSARRQLRYGPHRHQVGDLWLPDQQGARFPIVVLLHGGYWRPAYTKRLMHGLARDLVTRGWAAWNVEYRRVGLLGGGGGGWPGTFDDVALAIDALSGLEEIDLAKVVCCGHSAGGHLALWAAARDRVDCSELQHTGSRAIVSIRLAISLAGVVDLVEGVRLQLGDGAIEGLVGGGPDVVAERYRLASPFELLPFGVPQLLIHGNDDETVPASMSRYYVDKARALGEEATFVGLDGVDHMQVIDPDGLAWKNVVEQLEGL